jgi:hypothetical protein
MSASPVITADSRDPPKEERETKRRRSAPPPLDLSTALHLKPEINVDVVEDGDVLLVVSGLKGEQKP